MSYKIKRYNRIYRRRSPWRDPKLWIGIALLVGLAIFVGISMADPIRNFLAGDFVQKSSTSSGSSESSIAALPDVSGSENANSVGTSPVDSAHLIAVQASHEQLTLDNIEGLIADVKASGANAVVIEMKSSDGMLYFRSQTEIAKVADATSLSAIDVRTVTELLREEGIVPIALLQAFRDDMAHNHNQDTDMYVKYEPNPTMIWLDESKDNGGRPWLNPYNQQAQAYIIDLSKELLEMGFGHIMLESAQFPDVLGLEFAVFENPTGQTKQEALTSFIADLRGEIEPYGASVILSVSGRDALYGNDNAYGGSPFSLGADIYAVNLVPSMVGEDLEIGEAIYTNPAYDVFNFYTSALTAIRNAHPEASLMPLADRDADDQLESVLGIFSRFGLTSYYLYETSDGEVAEPTDEEAVAPENVISGQQEEEERRQSEEEVSDGSDTSDAIDVSDSSGSSNESSTPSESEISASSEPVSPSSTPSNDRWEW